MTVFVWLDERPDRSMRTSRHARPTDRRRVAQRFTRPAADGERPHRMSPASSQRRLDAARDRERDLLNDRPYPISMWRS